MRSVPPDALDVVQPAREPCRRRLLVVDDEAVQRLIVTRAADTLGFQTEGAATLADALLCTRATAYDAVVLDLGLGEHDGVELLRHLNGGPTRPMLVFISGHDARVRQAAARLAAALGLAVAGTLGKPLSIEALLGVLGTIPPARTAAAPPDAAEPIALPTLAGAIDNHEIVCLFQPNVDLTTRRVAGVEVLAHWQSPTLGLVPPGRLIPAAEQAGLIGPLSWHFLDAALDGWRKIHNEFPALTLAASLPSVALGDITVPDRVFAILAKYDVPPSGLVLEVTENAVMADYVTAADILTRLRIRGIGLAIDDFGTGHSSLLSLLRLPFSELKIGRHFVQSCHDDPEAPKVIRGVVTLARELGLQLVAGGIESEPAAALLCRLGCRVGQGHLFTPPLSPQRLIEWIRAAATPDSPQ